MMDADTRGSRSLEELMQSARESALLDDWTLDGDDVRLKVGTYELELHRQAADLFVRGLLHNHRQALGEMRG